MKKAAISLVCVLSALVISFGCSSASVYSVTLAWDPPTTNADGTPLTDLAGYKVYYGTQSHAYDYKMKIVGRDVTTCTINGLSPNTTYYFAVKAFDKPGNYSDFSNKISFAKYFLTVNKGGTGKGLVTSSPIGINCGLDCEELYSINKVVTLTAAPKAGSIFSGWSGGGCTGNGQCALSINAKTIVSANFQSIPTSVTVTSPNAGETWQAGTSDNTISWTYAGNPGGNVKIQLYKGGVLNKTIISSTPIGSNGSGSFNWTIPAGQIPGTDYKIQVISTTNSSYKDISDRNFTIRR